MEMQANTVGIATQPKTKDIYIIRNRINEKVYIGQSVNAAERFIKHCKPSAAKDNSLIDKAIQKYGADNFWFEILEHDVEPYNDREKFWIETYNSIAPNGYNLLRGGNEPPVHYALDHPNSSFDGIEEVHQIKEELKNTRLSFSEIAKTHNTSKRTIMRINQGLHYEEIGDKYPIREVPNLCGKLDDEKVKEIIEVLMSTYRQYEDIARQYGISISGVKQINSGDCHPIDGVTYPIRNYKNSGTPACTYAQVTEISNLLKDTDMSCNQIAKCFGVDLQTVYIINNGNAKRYRRDNLTYPLRRHNTGRRPCNDYPR